ncbi:hypothetical protein AAFC00_003208 [Neodothiora populina]|uniref:NAD(+) diphosphatase n=1 Tax=Neodothiora populina TaxID=2781224 RepID=A0ABR3P9X4_9PEZI
MPIPDLPQPAHPALDSMLSRKFGKEVANYFAGSPLNRFGFLRGDSGFLSSALRHPSTLILPLRDLSPLIKDKTALEFVKYRDVEPIIGDAYQQPEDEMVGQYNSTKHIPQMIFLGLDESVKDAFKYEHKGSSINGAPYFALDVTPRDSVKDACEDLLKNLEQKGLSFAPGRAMDLVAGHAAIYAEARQLLDWNLRNPFCAQCGHPTLSINGGFKRVCPPTDLADLPSSAQVTTSQSADPNITARPPCATRKGVSNISFPRTDPTIIVAIVNHANTHILLGRQKRWPQYWYSTLAGFCEPAESIEEATRREAWEEAGVHIGRVVIHSTQPWPYPANLMIGAIGQSVPGDGEEIDLGNDPELEDAKWFSFDEVKDALKTGTSALGEDAGPGYKEGSLRLPPSTAIANQLMTAVINGFLDPQPGRSSNI